VTAPSPSVCWGRGTNQRRSHPVEGSHEVRFSPRAGGRTEGDDRAAATALGRAREDTQSASVCTTRRRSPKMQNAEPPPQRSSTTNGTRHTDRLRWVPLRLWVWLPARSGRFPAVEKRQRRGFHGYHAGLEQMSKPLNPPTNGASEELTASASATTAARRASRPACTTRSIPRSPLPTRNESGH